MSDRANDSLTPAPSPFDGEEALFAAALERPESDRSAFLDQVCQGNPALRRRVEILLAADAQPDPRLKVPGDDALMRARSERFDANRDDAIGQTLGRYKLLERIGEGGCGVVYVAEQTQPVRRRVALKIIKLGMDTKAVIARFEAERQALALMDHTHTAKVLDAATTETGRPYFIMELVPGVPITEFCDQNHLGTRERLELFVKVCQAIQHAHQKGIIHRDIKPSNILVALHDGVPVPKVIDFGIAKAMGGRLTDATLHTHLHQFIGTPAYVSPQQAKLGGMDIDTRSDIYSLGVLLYELLTGHTPFDTKLLLAQGIDNLRQTIREQEPERPSAKLRQAKRALGSAAPSSAFHTPNSALDPDLDWIVMKCLEKDRNRRYETANGLAADLKRHLANEPVVARPPGAGYRLQKAFRRNRLLFTSGITVIAALWISTVVSSWQVFETKKARNAEQKQRLAAQIALREAERAQAAERQERLRADSEKLTAQRHLYAANMNLAQQAWDQSNLGRLRQLLQEEIAYPDRGFEWDYWQGQMHLELKTFRGHGAAITSVAISPNNRRMVTASSDRTAKIWDWAGGESVITLTGHTNQIWSAAFSPDSRLVVTGSDDCMAKVWDAESGRELLTLKGHIESIPSVAFSPDGKRIVTVSRDSKVKVWDAATGVELRVLQGLRREVYAVAFSPDGRRVAAGGVENVTKVWDVDSGRELLSLGGHDLMIWSLAFSPDGQRLATGSDDRTVGIWNVVSGDRTATLQGHSAGILSVAFSPDGQRIVSGSVDQTAKVWEVSSGRELYSIKGHRDRVTSVAFSADGRRIMTASEDWTAKVWEAADSARRDRLIAPDPILSVAISPNGQEIVTGTVHENILVWNANSAQMVRTLTGHRASILALTFSPNGKRIVSGSWDRTAKIWDAADGHELLTLVGHTNRITSVSVSPDNQRVVTASLDGTARVWNMASGQELLRIDGHEGAINSAAFSPDGQRFITGGRDQTAKVWDAATGRELLTLKGHKDTVNSAAFSPDGQRIVTGDRDQTAKVWDAATGRELLTLKGHKAGIHAVNFAPDGRRIITASADHTAMFWDAGTGRELMTFRGHSDRIRSVAISADGQEIVTGSEDQTARIWRRPSAAQVSDWEKEEPMAERP